MYGHRANGLLTTEKHDGPNPPLKSNHPEEYRIYIQNSRQAPHITLFQKRYPSVLPLPTPTERLFGAENARRTVKSLF